MEYKQEFKETIIKSRSEYLKKKNEMALNMAKERYEINNMLENELKRNKN
jgi:DNA-directed RNA polymerase subunit L